jgi:predicted SAM-dependent methyltransferase
MFAAGRIAILLPPSVKARLKPYYFKAVSLGRTFKTKIAAFLGKAKRAIIPARLPSPGEGVLVNLGCGLTNHPKFINVDGYPHRHVHYINRIDRLKMFLNDSVDLIYASHCLEHFKYRDIDRVLSEWNRVLRPGGILRLSVPDLDKLLAIYRDTGNPDDIVEQLMGGQDNRYNFHYVLFNRKNLTNHLARSGFTDAREWIPGSDDLTTFDDFSVYHKTVEGKEYPVSLNLEAKKAESK